MAGEVREVGRWGRDCIDSYTMVTPPNPLWSLQTDHHPEWFNVYNRVEVTLATHTCNGVSDKVRGRGGGVGGVGRPSLGSAGNVHPQPQCLGRLDTSASLLLHGTCSD